MMIDVEALSPGRAVLACSDLPGKEPLLVQKRGEVEANRYAVLLL